MIWSSIMLVAAVSLSPVGAGSSVASNGSAVASNKPAEVSRPPASLAAPAKSVGWPESGEMQLSFAAAKKKLAVKLAKRGWRHVHTIELAKDRHLEAWDRGGDELTLMVWRIGTGRTGYSLGITKKARK